RYGLLTGRHWSRTDASLVTELNSHSVFDRQRMTLPEMLQATGYRTYGTGKWHLGIEWARRGAGGIDFGQPFSDGPLEHGFDEFYGIPGATTSPPFVFIDGDSVDASTVTPGYTPGASDPDYFNAGDRATDPLFDEMDVMPAVTSRTIDFIKQHFEDIEIGALPADTPMFVYYSLTAPHTPLVPTDSPRGSNPTTPQFDGTAPPPYDATAGVSHYTDFIQQIDWSVGQVLAALDDPNGDGSSADSIVDDTIVIFASDNGSAARGDRGLTIGQAIRVHDHDANGLLGGLKGDAYEAGHRVPFIVRWPGQVTAGSANDKLLTLEDVMATLAAVIDFDLPGDAAEDSFDLSSYWTQGTAASTIRTYAVLSDFDHRHLIREDDYSLVFGVGSGGITNPAHLGPSGATWGMLFDLDPLRGGDPYQGADQTIDNGLLDGDEAVTLGQDTFDGNPSVVASMADLYHRHMTLGHTLGLGTKRYPASGAYWRFDDDGVAAGESPTAFDVTDDVSSNHSTSIVGSPVYDTDVPVASIGTTARSNTLSLDFEADDADAVIVEHPAEVRFNSFVSADGSGNEVSNESFTIQAWVRLESYRSRNMIVSKKPAAAFDNFANYLFWVRPNGQLAFQFGSGGAATIVNSTFSSAVPLDTWVHLS
ncbi:MAG: sulfatase-like hydrolase/transferase, partial [Polyangiales bacterium]